MDVIRIVFSLAMFVLFLWLVWLAVGWFMRFVGKLLRAGIVAAETERLAVSHSFSRRADIASGEKQRRAEGEAMGTNQSPLPSIDYGKFRLSLRRLDEQHANYRKAHTPRPQLDQEAVAESVIQRFETCYDCLWKVLRRHLIERIGIPDVPNGPNPVFRLADQNHLLPSSIDSWLAYAQKRIDTTHDYDGEKAVSCLEVVPDFIGDAKALYQTLSGDAWQ